MEGFFEITLHFGIRGREGLKELKTHDIVFTVDSESRPFVTLAFNPLEINHQGLDAKDHDHDQCMDKTQACRGPSIVNLEVIYGQAASLL